MKLNPVDAAYLLRHPYCEICGFEEAVAVRHDNHVRFEDTWSVCQDCFEVSQATEQLLHPNEN
jgi:hypothetical protein